MCKDLATSYDRIRRTYWDYVARGIVQSQEKTNEVNHTASASPNEISPDTNQPEVTDGNLSEISTPVSATPT
jgi:hypothetical protein